MKRILVFITTGFTSLFIAAPAFADSLSVNLCPTQGTGGTGSTSSQFYGLCALSSGNFSQLVGLALQLLFVVAVIIALFFLVWGGIKWILSGGDKSAVEGARNTIVAALIGLAITFLAYFLLTFVVKIFLPNFDINNLVLPHV